MKIDLNQSLVLRLKFDQKPVEEKDGKITKTVPNTAIYSLTDTHQDAPRGFSLKVARTKKTYFIQRRQGAKVIKVKICNVSDYTVDEARRLARKMAQTIEETGTNPNVVAREIQTAELSIGECFRRYREYLVNKPCKPTTLKTLDKCLKKLIDWEHIKVKDLSSEMILARFDDIKSKTPTTAEQAFNWANASIAYSLKVEQFEAKKAGRIPSLTINPIEILKVQNKFRTKIQLEAAYEAKGIRKPLSVRDTLGPFLNAVWARRKENRTGCDFILCSLLWGTRKLEGANLRWRDSLSDKEAESASWVDLKAGKIFFFDTKNGTNLILPISQAVFEILKQRNEMREDATTDHQRNWVFPARSKFSKEGNYTDGSSLLKYICQDAEITKRASHDFRRTFGAAAEQLVTFKMVKRLLNHFDSSDSTWKYTATEWDNTKEALQRIELHLLAPAPVVYNALLTPTFPPIQDGRQETKEDTAGNTA